MILYGAGGHAHVVFDSLKKQGIKVKGVFDDNPEIGLFNGLSVQHNYSSQVFIDELLIIAIGSNKLRSELWTKINHNFGIVIDNSAYLADSCLVQKGTMILANAIVQSNSKVGRHAIINSGAIIEHNGLVGDFVHIGPGCVICGGVEIGEGALVGANATVLPGIKIGSWAVIGAGAVILEDVPDASVVVGNPGKIV